MLCVNELIKLGWTLLNFPLRVTMATAKRQAGEDGGTGNHTGGDKHITCKSATSLTQERAGGTAGQNGRQQRTTFNFIFLFFFSSFIAALQV